MTEKPVAMGLYYANDTVSNHVALVYMWNHIKIYLQGDYE